VLFDRDAVAASYEDVLLGFKDPPVHLATFDLSGTPLRWDLHRTLTDHLVHLDEVYATPLYLRGWAYVEIVSRSAWTGCAHLLTNGPAAFWLNEDYVAGHHRFSEGAPGDASFELSLVSGVNRLLVRFDQVGWGSTIYTLGLQLQDLEGAELRLPTGADRVADFHAYEALFELASLDRDVFVDGDNVALHWPEDLEAVSKARGIPAHPRISLRAQTPDGRIIAETLGRPRAGEPTKTMPALNLPLGPFQAVLMPDPETYSEGQVRVRRTFDLTVLNQAPAVADARPYAKRLYEAVHLAMREGDTLLRAVAAMTLDAWRYVGEDAVVRYIESELPADVNRRRGLLALLGVLYRYSAHEAFPERLTRAIERAVELPDSMERPLGAENDELGGLLLWTVRILVGQRYPNHLLSDGRRGRDLRGEAETQVTAWLFRAGRYGLRALADDGEMLDTLIFALSHLADLAETTLVRELAAILLDKVLFTVALNSFRGVGRGGLLGTTAAVGRVVWGSGVLNTHLWSIVGLANARSYPIPPLIPSVGQGASRDGDDIEPVWQTEYHKDPGGRWGYRRATYHTPEVMLSSIQDEQAPASRRMSLWRAVLGPEATVIVNRPAHAGTRADIVPNFWHGDRSPPVVVQWHDTLIACYDLDDGGPLSFTHAHFPIHAFDEHALRDNWAFARKGGAYAALTASRPLTLMREGPGAHRELRAEGAATDPVGGTGTFWLCHVGSAAVHGDFSAFRDRVSAQEPHFEIRGGDVTARWTTPRGVIIGMSPAGQLTVDGEVEELDEFHYATPYCRVDFPADTMDIRVGDALLRLDFSE
jgi:hypothetical protein